MQQNILTIGSGHLACRVVKLLEKNNYTVTHIEDIFEIKDTKNSTLDKISKTLQKIDLSSLKMVYLLDDNDERNLELIIAFIALGKDLHITASFFNENIAPHLQARHPNIQILNPARIAAKTFVNALYEPITRSLHYEPVKITNEKIRSSNLLIKILILAFVTIGFFAIAYFHFHEKMTLINSLYFVVTTIATVGYGDISLLNSSSLTKIIGISLMISSILFTWIIFSLIMDHLIKERIQRLLGRKKYYFKNHVIVCGLGRLGYFISEELIRQGEKVLIIEQNENSEHVDHFRNLGASVYIGNARLPRILQDVNVSKAKAIFAVINNDSLNLGIGLNARSIQPNLRLVLRIFDDSIANSINENLDIHFTLSMSAVADEKFYELINNS